MCILDETDSGLDVDAMKLVAEGVNALRDAGRGFPGHHPLPAPARPYQTRCGAHHGRRPDREDRRAGTGARGRTQRLCRHPGGGGVMAVPQRETDATRGAARRRWRCPTAAAWAARRAQAALARLRGDGPARAARRILALSPDPTALNAPDAGRGGGVRRRRRSAGLRRRRPAQGGVRRRRVRRRRSPTIRWRWRGSRSSGWRMPRHAISTGRRDSYGVLEARGQTPVARPLRGAQHRLCRPTAW